jgi:hypothetical protein
MLKRLLMFGALLTVGLVAAAQAEEKTLSRDTGSPTEYVQLDQDAHYISLESPADWKAVFSEAVSFYGQRYGDVKGLKGTVVFWVPATPPKIATHNKNLGPLKLLFTKEFDLSSVPDHPGWVEIPVDAQPLPHFFAVSLYTYSNDQRGVKVALGGTAQEGRLDSYSSSTHPGAEGAATSIKFRHDGKDWLVRVKVRDTLAPPVQMDSNSIGGANFSVYDDGGAENYYSFQKKGALLRCENSAARSIDAVYVFGKLAGNWVGTTRFATILILGDDYKVLGRAKLPYNDYSNTPAWNLVSFSPVRVGKVFYVAVQPNSAPDVQMLIGVDSSGPNRASSYGTSGAELDWNLTLPKDKTNWMIRARYSK